MALNDMLAALLIKIGLRKTEAQRLHSEIERLEEHIRDLQDDLDDKVDESGRLVDKMRRLQGRRDAAAPAERLLLEDQIRSLMRDFKHLKERQSFALRNIEKAKLLLQNRKLEFEHLKHPVDAFEIEDVTEAKREMLEEMREEDAEISKLDGMTYEREHMEEQASNGDEMVKARSAALDRELEALIGKPESSTNQETSSEQPPEIA